MSSDSSIQNHTSVKVFSAFVISTAVDKYIFNETELKHNLTYGASTAGGIFIGSMLGSYLPDILPKSTFYSGKTIGQRAFEIIFGSGVSYAVFQMSGMNYNNADMSKRLALLVATDAASDYIGDYFTGVPLSYLE